MLSDYEIFEVGILLLGNRSLRSVEALFHTLQRTLRGLKENLAVDKLCVEEWKSLSDLERRNRFYPSPPAETADNPAELADLFEKTYQKLKRPGSHYSIKSGWVEYEKKHPGGMQNRSSIFDIENGNN